MDELLERIMDAAEAVAPIIGAATGRSEEVAAGLAAANAVLQLLDKAEEIFGKGEARITATRSELEARVNAHADSTAASLGGE